MKTQMIKTGMLTGLLVISMAFISVAQNNNNLSHTADEM